VYLQYEWYNPLLELSVFTLLIFVWFDLNVIKAMKTQTQGHFQTKNITMTSRKSPACFSNISTDWQLVQTDSIAEFINTETLWNELSIIDPEDIIEPRREPETEIQKDKQRQ